VLVLAQQEAGLLNHSFIGTEHILLGLIHENDGVAAKALASLDISLEAVRDKVDETIGIGSGVPMSSPPFTPRAKKVLELALREALQMGHSYIGTEHLLLGLLREGEGVAATVLVSLGADLSRVRQRVLQLLPGTEVEELTGDPSVTGRSLTVPFGVELQPNRGPLCPQCRASLSDAARYRTMAVDAESGDEEPISIDVVFCQQCGVTIDAFRSVG
jgi:ATP-dependent Clp protease ATP-binding subunit ClpC